MYSVDAFLEQLTQTVTSAPETCTSEECILQWVIHETQVIQSIYDSAIDAGLAPEEVTQIEELYRHKLQSVLEIGLATLGASEL